MGADSRQSSAVRVSFSVRDDDQVDAHVDFGLRVEVGPTAVIGCVNKTLDAVSIARRNGVGLPALTSGVVYRPNWFHPVVLSGTAEPYNPNDRSLRGRLRRVPPPARAPAEPV